MGMCFETNGFLAKLVRHTGAMNRFVRTVLVGRYEAVFVWKSSGRKSALQCKCRMRRRFRFKLFSCNYNIKLSLLG